MNVKRDRSRSSRNRARTVVLRSLVVASALAVGCTPPPEPPKAAPPPAPVAPAPPPTQVVSAVPDREAPPASAAPRELTLPAPAWDTLANGLEVATIASAALPIVQIRVVVRAGSAADGDRPGLAVLTGELLAEGGAGTMSSRELFARVESLGATLQVGTSFDRTTLSIAVTKDHFTEALDLVAAVTTKPTMSAPELTKLRKRMVEKAADNARTSGEWAASMMLYRGLFGGGQARHPYATYDATAAEIGKLTGADCRAFHKQHFVPKGMFVVVAGDVAQADVKAAVDKAFGGLTGGEPTRAVIPAPAAPAELRITLVDRPKSTQSDVYAGLLAPERTAASWPAFATANQVLGGGMTGRLFLEVREKASLAYNARSSLHELGQGPSVLVAYAGTQSAKTGLAVKAVLDQLERLGTTEPSADEVTTATRFLADSMAIRLETIGAVANELVKNRMLGLPDDHPAQLRKQLRAVTAAEAAKVAAEHVRTSRVALVVAGDAKVVGPMLSHFGEVKVVDPTKGFTVGETIAKNPEASLELKEEAGK